MDTHTSTQRTRATATMVLLLLVGLCSFVVGGPLQAGAQEPEGASLPDFVESEALSFADGSWLGFVSEFVPASAFASAAPDTPGDGAPTTSDEVPGEAPITVEADYSVTECSASGTLSVTYTISAPAGVTMVRLLGSLGDEPFERDVDFDQGAPSLVVSETFDLAAVKATYWKQAVLMLDAANSNGDVVERFSSLTVDFDDCTVREYSETAEPTVELGEPMLTSCDSSPKLAVPYTVVAEGGIAKIQVDGLTGYEIIDRRVDLDASATMLEDTEAFSLDYLTNGSLEEELDQELNNVTVTIRAFDPDGRMGYAPLAITVDVADCTFVPTDPEPPEEIGGDGKYPEITIDSVEVAQCDTTPTLTLSFTVTDSDGIAEIWGYADLDSEELPRPIEFESGETTVQLDWVVAVDNPDDEITPGIEVTDKYDTYSASYPTVSVDVDSCTAEVEDPDSWGLPDSGGDDWGGPTIAVDSIAIAACDATPTVSIDYTITDEDGIVFASFFVPDAAPVPFIEVPDAFGGKNELTGTAEVSMDLLGESKVETWLSIDAEDSNENPSWFDLWVRIDLDSCTIERHNPWR